MKKNKSILLSILIFCNIVVSSCGMSSKQLDVISQGIENFYEAEYPGEKFEVYKATSSRDIFGQSERFYIRNLNDGITAETYGILESGSKQDDYFIEKMKQETERIARKKLNKLFHESVMVNANSSIDKRKFELGILILNALEYYKKNGFQASFSMSVYIVTTDEPINWEQEKKFIYQAYQEFIEVYQEIPEYEYYLSVSYLKPKVKTKIMLNEVAVNRTQFQDREIVRKYVIMNEQPIKSEKDIKVKEREQR